MNTVPIFALPQFSPLFRSSVPLVINDRMADELSLLIRETFDDGDHSSLYGLAMQLEKYVQNCARYDDGLASIPQRPPVRPRIQTCAMDANNHEG
jgi:hypothetical protein